MHNSVSSDKVFVQNLFNGKVVFATGGGSGIVKQIVQQMMLHGADAVIIGRRKEVIESAAKELSHKSGRRCIGISADVRSSESLKAAAKQATSEFGRIDFVICGAAGNFLSPIDGLSENAFKTVMEIDLLGSYNTIKATMAEVKKVQGSYLAISATLHYTGTILQAHVSAAKAGVDALSRVLAVELGPHGVRSNIIAPGPIANTEGMSRLATAEDRESKVGRKIPAQRMGTTDDIANAAVFLFSPAASYINATELVVDGGAWHMGQLMFPYPETVQNTANFREMIKGKL